MLFEELVEQHRVHRFVAHTVRLALVIASDQIGVHLFHLLGNEAELRDTLGVKLLLVAEGDWFERENRFARFVNRLDRLFETLRGNDRPEVTLGIYDYPYASCNRYPIDPGDKDVRVPFSSADADCVGLARNASVGNIDIVTASGEISTGFSAQCDVERTSGIARECIVTDGRVVVAACVARERKNTGGRVAVARSIACERIKTVGRVVVASGVARERIKTRGRVVVASGVASERSKTRGRVVVASYVVTEHKSAVGRVVATRAISYERIKTGSRVAVTRGVATQSIKTYGYVLIANRVQTERTKTDSRVLVSRAQKKRRKTYGYVPKAIGVAIERCYPEGCIVDPPSITPEGRGTNRRVAEAACVAKERVKTDCRVAEAGCKAKERIVTLGGVLTGIAAARWWDNRLRRRRKRKTGEREQRERRTRSISCCFSCVYFVSSLYFGFSRAEVSKNVPEQKFSEPVAHGECWGRGPGALG